MNHTKAMKLRVLNPIFSPIFTLSTDTQLCTISQMGMTTCAFLPSKSMSLPAWFLR